MRELVTNDLNLLIEAVAVNTSDVVEITRLLNEKDVVVNSSEIVTSHYTRPFGFFEPVNVDTIDDLRNSQ